MSVCKVMLFIKTLIMEAKIGNDIDVQKQGINQILCCKRQCSYQPIKQKSKLHMHPLTNLIVLFSISIIDSFNVHIVPKCKESYMLCPYIYMYVKNVCIYTHMYLYTCISIYLTHTCFMHIHYIYIFKSDMNCLIL